MYSGQTISCGGSMVDGQEPIPQSPLRRRVLAEARSGQMPLSSPLPSAPSRSEVRREPLSIWGWRAGVRGSSAIRLDTISSKLCVALMALPQQLCRTLWSSTLLCLPCNRYAFRVVSYARWKWSRSRGSPMQLAQEVDIFLTERNLLFRRLFMEGGNL